ncbi:MAG: hypothetical protein WBA89_05775 [Microcoleus sp.]|uniref:hypothetical protein n=1 Tax=Microcoleus sp. TaxID=44472 RepID=UPI003C74C6A4
MPIDLYLKSGDYIWFFGRTIAPGASVFDLRAIALYARFFSSNQFLPKLIKFLLARSHTAPIE